ncbi:MAG: hypothetical protein FJY65_08250 [Calditrichaeota bacterium]|nr:hypothetical protein [Calditrichota bacterium]
MSESWRDQPVELRLHSGKALRGLFAGAVDSQFQIRNNLEVAKVPVVDIREVVLRRQPQDLAMVGLTSAGVSALLTAGAMLGSKTTKQQQIVVAGIGAAIGFAIGWKAFYQNIVIQIE